MTVAAWGQATAADVAIHDSELTRALETMPASGRARPEHGHERLPMVATDWHYFVHARVSQEKAAIGRHQAFTVVGDSNITAGLLLTNRSASHTLSSSAWPRGDSGR